MTKGLYPPQGLTDQKQAAELERVRAAAVQDAGQFLSHDQQTVDLLAAMQAAQVAANLRAAGWPSQRIQILAEAYRSTILQEVRDAQQAAGQS